MKHLKKFNESSDSKIELLRDVFENLEDEFDVDVEYHCSGEAEKEKIISAVVKLDNYIKPELLDRLIELTNMSIGYCGLDFIEWRIFSGKSGLISTTRDGLTAYGLLLSQSSMYTRRPDVEKIESIKYIFDHASVSTRYKYTNIHIRFRDLN